MRRASLCRRAAVVALGVSAAGLAFLPAGPARAEAGGEQRQLDEAREAFRLGAAEAKLGRWEAALVQFKRSAALRPHAATTYNTGYCELQLGLVTRARASLRSALEEDRSRGGELGDTLRAGAREHLASAESKVARLVLEGADDHVLVSIDGRPLALEKAGLAPVLVAGVRPAGPAEPVPAGAVTVLLDPGSHELRVERVDGVGAQVRTLGLEAGERRPLRLEAPVAPSFGPQRTAAVVAGALGLGWLAAGAALGSVAAVTWGDARAACPIADRCPDARGPSLAAAARLQANLATAGLVAGGAALAGGVALFLTAPRVSAPRVALRLGPAGVGVRLTW